MVSVAFLFSFSFFQINHQKNFQEKIESRRYIIDDNVLEETGFYEEKNEDKITSEVYTGNKIIFAVATKKNMHVATTKQ